MDLIHIMTFAEIHASFEGVSNYAFLVVVALTHVNYHTRVYMKQDNDALTPRSQLSHSVKS